MWHICIWITLTLYSANSAEYAKLPMIPPFLQPSAEYINGVNFASGGAGVLSETNQGLVSNSLLFLIR